MQIFSLGFVFGVISLLFYSKLLNLTLSAAILSISLIIYLVITKIFPNKIIKFFIAFLIGNSWGMLIADCELKDSLITAIENKNCIIQGQIVSIPENLSYGKRFLFKIKALQSDNKNYPFPHLVRLVWANKSQPVRVGESWQFKVKLKRPHSTLNPGGFDLEAWVFEHDLRAIGSVKFSQENKLLANQSYFYVDQLRENLHKKIISYLNNNAMTGFVSALTVGIRDEITAQQWQILRQTGTNHLMAIAGLHIGFLSAITFFFIIQICRLSSTLIKKIPAYDLAAIFALLLAVFYSALSGFALPAQRASIMVAIFLIANLWRRNFTAWHAYILAMFVILLIHPMSILAASFWLSFITVGWIIYSTQGRHHKTNHIKSLLKIQLIITIGLIPLSLYFFQQVSMAGIIANAIAIPWILFLILPLCFCGILFSFNNLFAAKIFLLAAKLLAVMWLILEYIADLSWLQWTAVPNNLSLLLATLSISLLLGPPIPYRNMAVIGLLPLFLIKPKTIANKEINFTLLDVGQGLSAIVQTANHTLVYDTGTRFSGGLNMGESVIAPYLNRMGIQTIDVLVISHSDIDHRGGADFLIRNFKVNKIITSATHYFPYKITAACHRGMKWQWDDVEFFILYPPAKQTYQDNDSSCVLKISTNDKSILLPGDIEKKSENYLVKNFGSFLRANILVAPHHGSKTSSTLNFINAVQPQYVLFPVGYMNSYHFPNLTILARYQQQNALDYDSVTNGAIFFQVMPFRVLRSPMTYRQFEGHFWNTPA